MAVISNNAEAANLAYNSRQKLRNKKKKLRKKLSVRRKREEKSNGPTNILPIYDASTLYNNQSADEIVEFEYKGAFQRFKLLDSDDGSSSKPISQTTANLKARTAALLAEEASSNEGKQKRSSDSDSSQSNRNKFARESDTSNSAPAAETLSKKKLKRLNQPSVAGLKQMVSRPDVVEMWDVYARDPLLLIYLKSYRNTVPVPRHWCAKRKYLQGKRGFEKPPFRLPDFIARTGIMEMRQTVQDKDADKTLKTKMREKIRPKTGKVDIDYGKLHDAFFKYQSKPKLSTHGDLYYEGKEFEVKLKEKKPGNLSDDLRNALGLPSGSGAERYPPPWLIAMQRYGPPPSYPNLKIPGLNAPIPDGCAFGYHPGGWGKPPVDELGRPVYGDVFGNGGNIAGVPPPPPPPTTLEDADEQIAQGTITYWGELESDEESEGEDEGQDMDTEEDSDGESVAKASATEKMLATIPVAGSIVSNRAVDMGGLVTPAGGLITPSGVVSVNAGLETPQNTIELRKKTIEEAMDDSTGLVTPSTQLYRVLPETESNIQPSALMGSTKLYDVTGVAGAPTGMEAENPRDLMLRAARTSGTESQQQQQQGQTSAIKTGLGSAASVEHNIAISSKKYKEFKF